MRKTEFDDHAARYRELHKSNIAISGEAPEFFADYKMRDFRHLVDESGLSRAGRFLDFGCGVGTSIRPFRRHLPDATLVCTDVSTASLELARQAYGEEAEYALADGPALPFDSDGFDGAFACCVFHHIPQDEHRRALLEIRRVLKPDGLLMLYEHNPFNPLTVRSVRTCPFDANAVLIRAGRLRRACLEAGFRVQHPSYRVFFPAGLGGLRPLEGWLRWLPVGAQYYLAARA